MQMFWKTAMALTAALAISGTTACDESAEAEASSPGLQPGNLPSGSSAVAPMAGGQDPGSLAPMPSAQQKLAMAAQFDPRRPWLSRYLTSAEVTESKGFFIQFLEASPGRLHVPRVRKHRLHVRTAHLLRQIDGFFDQSDGARRQRD